MFAEILGVDGIVVIVVVALVLLLGGSRIPKLARGLGSASHEFRKGLEEGERGDASLSATDLHATQAKSESTEDAMSAGAGNDRPGET